MGCMGSSSLGTCDTVSQQCATLATPCHVLRASLPQKPAAEIVEATGRLLRDRRFRELTVDDVMAEAGLSRTVFYRHFDGLHDVVVGLLDELLARSCEADADEDDREMLRRSSRSWCATFREHGPLLLALDEAAHHDPRVEAAYRAWIDAHRRVSAELIERGVERGHTPPMPVHDVARGAHRDERRATCSTSSARRPASSTRTPRWRRSGPVWSQARRWPAT